MKKSLCFFLVLLCIQTAIFCQSEFFAAIRLAEKGEKVPASFVTETLWNTTKFFREFELEELIGFVESDPIMKDLLLAEGKMTSQIRQTVATNAQDYYKGFNFNLLADGIVKFLVSRTRAELNSAFFSRFKKAICSNKYDDLKLLFPETYTLLLSVSEHIYDYNSYLDAMKFAFEKDLSSIYSRIPLLAEKEPYRKLFRHTPELQSVFTSALYLADRIQRKHHPGNIIDNFPFNTIEEHWGPELKNLSNTVKTVRLLSSSLWDQRKDHGYWIDIKSFNLLFKKYDKGNLRAIHYYLGLLSLRSRVEKIKYVSGKEVKTLSEILQQIRSSIDSRSSFDSKSYKFESFLRGLLEKSVHIDRNLSDLKKNESATATYQFYNNILDFFAYAYDIENLLGIKNDGIQINKKWISLGRTLGNLYLDAKQKNYYSVAFQIVRIYDSLFVLDEKQLNRLKAKAKNNQPVFSDQEIEKLRSTKKIRSNILTYGSFITKVAMAETSDQINEAIAAIVEPVGGSSIKDISKFNIALNAYVGPFLGAETSNNSDNSGGLNSTGLIAPVGISVNTKFKAPVFSSAGIFLSILDFGAVTAYRFGEEDVKELPELKLQNIIAPGAYLTLKIKKVPLALGVGVQYGPQLRKIVTEPLGIEKNSSSWRFNVFLGVDLHLHNFITILK